MAGGYGGMMFKLRHVFSAASFYLLWGEILLETLEFDTGERKGVVKYPPTRESVGM